MSDEKLTDQQYENLRAVYQQLCSSRQAIDDFRAKLMVPRFLKLGRWPI